MLAPLEAAPRHELNLRLDDEHGADPFTDCLREQGSSLASRASSTETGAAAPASLGRLRTHQDVAAHVGREPAHDLADG